MGICGVFLKLRQMVEVQGVRMLSISAVSATPFHLYDPSPIPIAHSTLDIIGPLIIGIPGLVLTNASESA